MFRAEEVGCPNPLKVTEFDPPGPSEPTADAVPDDQVEPAITRAWRERAAYDDHLRTLQTLPKDETEFGKICHHLAPTLRSTFYQYGINAQDYDDCVSEVFLRLWKYRGSYANAGGGLQPWVNRIARNYTVDRLRAGGRTGQAWLCGDEGVAMAMNETMRRDPSEEIDDLITGQLTATTGLALVIAFIRKHDRDAGTQYSRLLYLRYVVALDPKPKLGGGERGPSAVRSELYRAREILRARFGSPDELLGYTD